MRRNFSFFLARRYLRPKRTSVSIITLICVAGVALGVGILLLVIAVMAGFAERAKELILGYEAHVYVENYPDPDGPPYPMNGWRGLAEKLKSAPGILAVQPTVEGFVLVDANGRRSAHRMRAFPGDDPVIRAQIELKEGALALDQSNTVVVSDHLASGLGVAIGDTVTLYSQGHLDQVVEAFQEAERDPVAKTRAADLRALLDKIEASGARRPSANNLIALEEEVVREAIGLLDEILAEADRKPTEAAALDQAAFFLNHQAEAPATEAPPGATPELFYPKDALLGHFEALAAVAEAPPETDREAALDAIKELVLPKELVVTGIFRQPPAPTAPSLFVPLHIGQELYSLEDAIHSLALRTADPYQARPVAASLEPLLPEGTKALAWMERPALKPYFYALANERRMMYFVLFFIMIVAAFCIMVTMITITVEKAKQIGVMKALGAMEAQIIGVFVLHGTIVGLVGALAGVGLAALIIRFRDQIQTALARIGMDPFPFETYGLERIPAQLAGGDIAIVCIGAFLLSSIASLIPAWNVARLDPAKALRKE
jgi:lipoprotein-releasing system permease protein